MEIVCSIDDLCYGDYYSGHGHTFEPDNLMGCLEFSPYIDKDMTNQDIIDAILDNINSYAWPDEFDNIEVSDQQLIAAIQAEISGDLEEKPFKNMDLGPEVQLFGYIHFYQEVISE